MWTFTYDKENRFKNTTSLLTRTMAQAWNAQGLLETITKAGARQRLQVEFDEKNEKDVEALQGVGGPKRHFSKFIYDWLRALKDLGRLHDFEVKSTQMMVVGERSFFLLVFLSSRFDFAKKVRFMKQS